MPRFTPPHPVPAGRPGRRRVIAAGWLAVLAAGGCYRNLPLNGPPAVGTKVELLLSDSARQQLTDRGVTLLHFGNASFGGIDGLVLATTDDSLTVRVASARVDAFADGMLYQQVSIAYADVTHIRLRKHNVAGTLAVVGAFGGLGLFVANRIGGTSSDETAR